MKTVVDHKGFTEAMNQGKTWTVLECTLVERKGADDWYWEIDKSVFNTNKGKIEGDTETIASGSDISSLDTIKKIWNNLIEKYNPDEYFVDQH